MKSISINAATCPYAAATSAPRSFLHLALLPLILAVTAAAASLSGCASYVNIPPDSPNDIAINSINVPPAPGAAKAALDYVVRNYPLAGGGEFAVRLPAQPTLNTYSKVLANLPDALPYDNTKNTLPVYDVHSIRMRGRDAWIDVVVPNPNLDRPVIEVRMYGNLSGWEVVSDRRWSLSVLSTNNQSPAAAGPSEMNQPSTPPAAAAPADGNAKPPDASPASPESGSIPEGMTPSATPNSTATTDQSAKPLVPLRPIKPAEKHQDDHHE